MYKMHQWALCSVYLGKAKHHVLVYARNPFFGFGPIPKLITKMADTLMNNKKCIEIMYKMHQCAVSSVYLGKAKHHVVYDRNHFFGFGPIPKLINKMADTFMNNKKCIEIMYKMHQCAVFSVYLGKAKHHVVYYRNHFFDFGPIPK